MSTNLHERVRLHLDAVYGVRDPEQPSTRSPGLGPDELEALTARVLDSIGLSGDAEAPEPYRNPWSERDVIAITYGDSIADADGDSGDSESSYSDSGDSAEGTALRAEFPLRVLKRFLDRYLKDVISGVHILPFFPFSSDDGFAVKDFRNVNPSLGTWDDIASIASSYRLMADLVINHGSSSSEWFNEFRAGKAPGRDYFYTAEPGTYLSAVVRPRTSPLLQEIRTPDGTRHVWCTFSHDQVDFDFRNPEVLLEFVSIVDLYLRKGVRIFRLDAVAFLWKEPGTNSLNLPETHEIVRLLRTVIEHRDPEALVITETNIPNRENLAYFGNSNEAHCVYNFSLPPLLLHALITGNSHHLKNWMMGMPPAQDGTTYFNFLASHDGIGLRPTEGILEDTEVESLIHVMESFGGRVSYRELEDGKNKPYEINISLFDALQGSEAGPDDLGIDRMTCAHAIMLALEGIPGIYIHSLLGTRNDYARFEATGHNRSLNRRRWHYEDLTALLADDDSDHRRVFDRLTALLRIRSQQPAFHPNATQFTLHLGEEIFAFWRQSRHRRQSIFCIANITRTEQRLPLASVNLIETESWRDLVSGQPIDDLDGELELKPYQVLWLSNAG